MQKLVEDSPSFRALLHEEHGVQVLMVSGEIDLHSIKLQGWVRRCEYTPTCHLR